MQVDRNSGVRGNVFAELEMELPALVPRNVAPKFIPFSAKYLANLDAQGLGPDSLKIGRRVVYPKASLIRWLEARTTTNCD